MAVRSWTIATRPLSTLSTRDQKENASSFARQKGVSQVDALVAVTNQLAMETFIQRIQPSASDRLAGAWIEPELGRVVVRLTGTDTDPLIDQAARAVDFPVVIATEATSTLDDRIQILRDPVARLWIASNESITGGAIDPKADGLRIGVTDSAVAIPAEVGAVLDKYKLTVDTNVTDGPFGDFDRGGRK